MCQCLTSPLALTAKSTFFVFDVAVFGRNRILPYDVASDHAISEKKITENNLPACWWSKYRIRRKVINEFRRGTRINIDVSITTRSSYELSIRTVSYTEYFMPPLQIPSLNQHITYVFNSLQNNLPERSAPGGISPRTKSAASILGIISEDFFSCPSLTATAAETFKGNIIMLLDCQKANKYCS